MKNLETLLTMGRVDIARLTTKRKVGGASYMVRLLRANAPPDEQPVSGYGMSLDEAVQNCLTGYHNKIAARLSR